MAGGLLAGLLLACGGSAVSTPVTPTHKALPSGGPTPTNVPASPPPATTSPTPATAPPSPLPTPHPATTPWVEGRVDAVVALYGPTPAGEALLRSLDLRQMEGEPGFFGSFGFGKWAGVGEARAAGVIHELSHSYWGGFPVRGRPGLNWGEPGEAAQSTAMASYHQDILAFMAQPPDDYELLRQRLRDLPDVSADNPEPIFHNLEADLVQTTGGNLGLVPPVLRKYWSEFLDDGKLDTWYEAAGWFQSLSAAERVAANKFLGLEHLDLRLYQELPPHKSGAEVLAGKAEVLAREERQRLRDLASQFDLLLGDPQNNEDFVFWRRYLRDKLELHQAHPQFLVSLGEPRAAGLSGALDFLAGIEESSPAEQARMLADEMLAQPLLVNFLPALENRPLLELFSSGEALPQGATLQATASFVQRLEEFGTKLDRVLAAAAKSPAQGAEALKDFLAETSFDEAADLKLFFDLFHDDDPATARLVMKALDKGTVRSLMEPVAFQMRVLFNPKGLLDQLDITVNAPDPDIRRGVGLLIEEPSGNFRVDEPFLERLYSVIAERSSHDPADTVQLIRYTPFPLEGMIMDQPDAASKMLASDLQLTISLVRDADRVLAPPWRIIYRLISADPELAAGLVIALDQQGETQIVTESLAYFAYDKDRAQRAPALAISLEATGRFLAELLERQGADWLESRLSESVELYRQRAAAEEVAPDFLARYRETLDAASATLPDGPPRALQDAIRPAFAPEGG